MGSGDQGAGLEVNRSKEVTVVAGRAAADPQ